MRLWRALPVLRPGYPAAATRRGRPPRTVALLRTGCYARVARTAAHTPGGKRPGDRGCSKSPQPNRAQEYMVTSRSFDVPARTQLNQQRGQTFPILVSLMQRLLAPDGC